MHDIVIKLGLGMEPKVYEYLVFKIIVIIVVRFNIGTAMRMA